MIEVEIRGQLDDASYIKLKSYLEQNGSFEGVQDREMYLLYDYPGYDHDPIKRDVDIRIRNTDGFCEFMVKHKASEGNSARREVSVALKDSDLSAAKELAKAFGCKKGLKMNRRKEIYSHLGVEWSLVTCPKNIRYYEAEKVVGENDDIETTKNELISHAQTIGVSYLNDDEMRDFIFWLDKEVNQEVDL